MDLNVPRAGSDLTEDTHHLYTPSTLNQRQKDKALLNVKWLTGLCDFFFFSLYERHSTVRGGKGLRVFAAARKTDEEEEVVLRGSLPVLCLICRSLLLVSLLRKRLAAAAIKVTMVSQSPAVSAVESDWPAFKGKDYQQAGSKE